MLKFNNDNILTGHIKQLLASFNLPKYRVYKSNTKILESTEDKVGNTKKIYPYIKENKIQLCTGIDNEKKLIWEDTGVHYHYNKADLNYTKKFQIKNNIYDTYTHEYLGDYLRFQRDYNNINLMSMYNCFSNKINNSIRGLQIALGENNKIIINASDSNYKIYMFPVKFFNNYTVAIDSVSVEIFCGFFGAYLDERTDYKDLPSHTYQKYSDTSFNRPLLYTKLYNIDDLDDVDVKKIANNESELKMFIRIPADNTSSITVLEGDYRGYNDLAIVNKYAENTTKNSIAVEHNYSVINFENSSKNKPINKLISPLQLLELNTGESYPFADRLIEYLVGNVVNPLDPISDNIRRAQVAARGNYNYKQNKYDYEATVSGEWDNNLTYVLYDHMNNPKNKISKSARLDNLGHVDRHTEKLFKKGNNGNTIANTDIYTDLYLANKK